MCLDPLVYFWFNPQVTWHSYLTSFFLFDASRRGEQSVIWQFITKTIKLMQLYDIGYIIFFNSYKQWDVVPPLWIRPWERSKNVYNNQIVTLMFLYDFYTLFIYIFVYYIFIDILCELLYDKMFINMSTCFFFLSFQN